MIPEYNLTNSTSYIFTGLIIQLSILALISSAFWIYGKIKYNKGAKKK